jgi:hypothetical protein
MSPKDEESAVDYNNGGYLQVRLSDLFKDGRYTIVRKLGYVLPLLFLGPRRFPSVGATSPPCGLSKTLCTSLSSLSHVLLPHPTPARIVTPP